MNSVTPNNAVTFKFNGDCDLEPRVSQVAGDLNRPIRSLAQIVEGEMEVVPRLYPANLRIKGGVSFGPPFFIRFLMISLSWNIRGAASDGTKRHPSEYVKQFNPSMVLLLETHVQFAKVPLFWERLGYSVMHVVEARGHSGGIWWLTSCQNVKVSVVEACDQAILEKEVFI